MFGETSDMAIEPLVLQDHESEIELINMLDRAANVLRTLSDETVLVAACPSKFNDAWYDDRWFAVQVGGAYWEAAHYLEGRDKPLIKEEGREQTSKGIRAARKVLEELEHSNWRTALSDCLGKQYVMPGDVVCLAIQFGQPWICSVSSNDTRDIACTWSSLNGLVHMARCERIDHSIGTPHPLCFADLRTDFWQHLAPSARAQLRPKVQDRQAAVELCRILMDAALTIDRTLAPQEKIALHASNSSWSSYNHENQPQVYFGREFGPSTVAVPIGTPMRWPKEPSKIFERLSGILDRLENAGWRQLFSKCIGGVVKDGDLVCLVSGLSQPPFLAWEMTAFDFWSRELTVLGLCNRGYRGGLDLEIFPVD